MYRSGVMGWREQYREFGFLMSCDCYWLLFVSEGDLWLQFVRLGPAGAVEQREGRKRFQTKTRRWRL